MGFKDMIMSVRSAVLCCGDHHGKGHKLEISLPTNVRKGALTMQGLPKEQEVLIREKASADADRSISLTSHPPSANNSAVPSPNLDTDIGANPTHIPPSPSASSPSSPTSQRTSSLPSLASTTPSTALLNSASKDLPTTLPTPPRMHHAEASAPPDSAHSMMKGFWQRTRRGSGMSASHCSITGSLKKSAGKGSLTNSLIGSLRGKGRKVSAQSSSGKEDIKGSYLDLDDDMFDGKIDGEFDAGFHGVGLVELSSQTHVRRPSLSNRKLSKTKTKTKVDRPSATGTTTASTDSVSGFETQDVVGGAEIKSSKIASPFDKEIAIESVPGTPAKETDMLLQQIDAGSPFLTTEEKNNRCESASSSDGEEQDTCAGAKNVEFSRMNNSRAKLSAVSVHEPLVS